jgi:predicted secreted protein
MEWFRMTLFPRTRRASLLLLGLPLLGVAGCSMFGTKPTTESATTPGAAPAAAPVAAVIRQPGKAAVEVTDAGNGARVVLERAQTLVVSLALAGNKSPDWMLVELPAGVTIASGPRFERATASPNGDDFSGSTVWHLRAAAAGEFTLRFELRRARSTQAPLQTVAFTVQVQ